MCLWQRFFCTKWKWIWFVLMLYVQVTTFQSCPDDFLSSLVEPVLSSGWIVLLKDTTQCLRWISNQQLFHLKSNTLPLSLHTPQQADLCLSHNIQYKQVFSWLGSYGPCREKTCLQGFWQREIQTSLLSYRD